MFKLRVPDMSCGHCKAAIEKAFSAADENTTLDINLETRVVSVASSLSEDAIIDTLDKAGYDASVMQEEQS